jgi:hypothetical protein
MAQSTCYGLEAKRFDVKAMTREASGRQLSSGARHADIEGMRAAIVLAVSLASTSGALAAAKSAHFHVGAEVVSSARLVARSTPLGIGMDSRVFGGEARVLLVEHRSGASVGVKGNAGVVQVPAEGQAPLLVRSAGELSFVSAGPAEVVVTLLADGIPPPLQKLNVTVMRSK